jgi:AraC-like DNA-binding protein
VGRELSTLALTPLVPSSPEQIQSDSHGFVARSYAINGFGEASKRWVGALQAGTKRTDLRFLTLLLLEGGVWPHAIFRRRRAWCAACYEDRRGAGDIIYEPLLWTLKAVTFCPQHRRFLDEVCPHCSRQSKAFAVFSRPGYCSNCTKWLGNSNPQPCPPASNGNDSEAALRYAEEAGKLLGALPGLDSSSLRSTFTANFRACVEVVAEGNKSAFADAAKITQATVTLLMTQRALPSIGMLLRISCRLKIPVMSFLQGDPVSAISHWQDARARIEIHRLPSARAPENIRAALVRAVSEQPPPRLSDVARRLNYMKLDRLLRLDRNLCRQIASNYQKSIRECWRKPSDKRFCSRSQIKRLLEQSLAQERPTALDHIALSMGYASGGISLQRKFPDLCRAIQEKIAAHKALAIASMERTLKLALREDPPPSLRQLCERLDCCRSVVLRRQFSSLCDRLLQRRRAYRARQIVNLKKTLQALVKESPPLSLEKVCKRVGWSRQHLIRLCPQGSAAIVTRYRRSLREKTQRRMQELYRQARRIVKRLHNAGIRPSYKRVSALLAKLGYKDGRGAYNAIKAARGERNIGSPTSG